MITLIIRLAVNRTSLSCLSGWICKKACYG